MGFSIRHSACVRFKPKALNQGPYSVGILHGNFVGTGDRYRTERCVWFQSLCPSTRHQHCNDDWLFDLITGFPMDRFLACICGLFNGHDFRNGGLLYSLARSRDGYDHNTRSGGRRGHGHRIDDWRDESASEMVTGDHRRRWNSRSGSSRNGHAQRCFFSYHRRHWQCPGFHRRNDRFYLDNPLGSHDPRPLFIRGCLPALFHHLAGDTSQA